MTTITALAAELNVSVEDINTYAGQIAAIDGDDATFVATEEVRNGSGRVIGTEMTLSAAAETFIRETIAAGIDTPTTLFVTVASCDYRTEVERHDVEAATEAEAIEQAQRLYGASVGVDWTDVTVEIDN